MPIHMDARKGYRPCQRGSKQVTYRAEPRLSRPAPPCYPADGPGRAAGQFTAVAQKAQNARRVKVERRQRYARRMRDLGDSNAGQTARRPPAPAARDRSGRRAAAREQAAPGPGYRDQQPGPRPGRLAGRHSAGGPAPGGQIPAGGPAASGNASTGANRTDGLPGGFPPVGGHRPGGAAGAAGWATAEADAAVGKGPVRGFPPAPGQPPPFYPPGQFAAWNPPGARPAPSQADRSWYGGSNPGGQAYDPGYPALAVSDPAADVTSTQTWEKIPGTGDAPDSGTWTNPRGTADSVAGGVPGAGLAGPGPGRPDHAGPDSTRAFAADPGRAAAGGGNGPAGPDGSGPGAGGGPGTATVLAPPSPAAPKPGSRTAQRAAARGGRPPRKPRRSPSVVLAVCAVLAFALAAGAFLFVTARHQGTRVAATAPPSTAPPASPSPSASPSLGPFGHIATRKTDSLPLNITQLYPAAFTATGLSFKRTISRLGKTCSTALVGSSLQNAVKAAKCTQVVRASYLAAGKKEMGTIGVLNLSTSRGATHAGHAAGASDFILQLKAKKGATHTLGKGTGIEEAATKGHYLILIWAQFTSHSKPKTKGQRKELANFMNDLFRQTANVSLSSRMVTGSP